MIIEELDDVFVMIEVILRSKKLSVISTRSFKKSLG